MRIILLLQSLQTTLAPGVSSVQLLRGLITIGVVDVGADAGVAARLEEDVTELVTQRLSLGVAGGIGRLVLNQRCGEDVLAAEGECGRVGGDGVHTFHGVALEHEDGAVEDGAAAHVAGIHVVGSGHRGGVVGVEIQRETRVGEAGAFLAGGGVGGDAGPAAEVEVGAVLVLDGERAQVAEGSGVSRVDALDTLLDDVEKNDGL